MSNKLSIIKNSGKMSADLDVTEYWGGIKEGWMLQLTQRLAGGFDQPDTAAYLELTPQDASQLIDILSKWLKKED